MLAEALTQALTIINRETIRIEGMLEFCMSLVNQNVCKLIIQIQFGYCVCSSSFYCPILGAVDASQLLLQIETTSGEFQSLQAFPTNLPASSRTAPHPCCRAT
jgi:hypothetical protein